MRPASVVQLGIVGAAVIAAVLLARPERVPAHLAPPPRSAISLAPDRAPAADDSTAECAGAEAEAADDPPPGRMLTRQDLETGLLKVRARALACKNEGPPPVVELHIVIAASGQVTSVGLPQELRGSRAAECISHAIRAASFPSWTPTEKVAQIEWTYPLRFDAAE